MKASSLDLVRGIILPKPGIDLGDYAARILEPHYGQSAVEIGLELTINQITREAIRLFTVGNWFLQNIGQQYENAFASDNARIGSTLRIRLPQAPGGVARTLYEYIDAPEPTDAQLASSEWTT